MRFNYQARTKRGEIQTGTVEAGSRQSAIDTLQRHDLAVVYLEAISSIPFYARSLKFLQRVKSKDLLMFYRQLAVLFEASIPPLSAMRAVAEQTDNPYFKDILFEIETDVRGGESLSKAMAKHKKVFPSFYINVIQAGEATGKVDEILRYLADHAENEYLLFRKIKGAFTYPIFIISLFAIIAVLMMVYVVPKLTAVLLEAGGELPMATKLLIGTSDFLRSWIWLLAIMVVGLVIGVPRLLKTPQGKKFWDRLQLRLPLFGNLFRKVYLTRFSENLSTLLKGGLPILESLRISGQVIGNTTFQKLIEDSIVEVKKGGTISSVFERDKKNVPSAVVQMLKVGEKTAKIDSILERIAKFYQGDIDRLVDNLTQLIEPILLVFLGGAVAFLVASILMPIYNITSGGF